MDEKLIKSLADLDAAADEILNKSEKDKDEKLSPEDISEDENDSNESEDKEDPAEEESKKEDEGNEEEPSDEGGDEDDVEKSIRSNFSSSEDIQKSIEVSDFLAALTEAMTESLLDVSGNVTNLAKSFASSQKDSEDLFKSIGSLAKSQQAIMQTQRGINTLVKSIADQIDTLSSRMDDIETQPAMRKSVESLNVKPKNFRKSLGGETEQLTKSQILAALQDKLSKGDGLVTIHDVIGVESGAPLRKDLIPVVNAYYKQI